MTLNIMGPSIDDTLHNITLYWGFLCWLRCFIYVMLAVIMLTVMALFANVSHFHPSLIFVNIAEFRHNTSYYGVVLERVGSGLACKYQTQNWLTVTNTLAYYVTQRTGTSKSFMTQALNLFSIQTGFTENRIYNRITKIQTRKVFF